MRNGVGLGSSLYHRFDGVFLVLVELMLAILVSPERFVADIERRECAERETGRVELSVQILICQIRFIIV